MSSYSNNHILFGNYGLSNKRIQIRELAVLDGSPNNLQVIPISRGTGSSIVRNRTEARSIKLAGGTTLTNYTNSEDSVLEMLDNVKKIFSYQKRFLRTVPKSKVTVLDSCQVATGWVNSADGGALSIDNTDFEWENASLKSTVTVSTGSATYTKTITAINLSSLANTGNFEFWLNLSDVYNISSIDFRVGSDSSNYYSTNLTTNYEANRFENGSNYFSVPWGNSVEGLKMTQTGTVNNASISYLYVKINYATTASNFTVKLGGFFHVQEDFCRNFLCSLDGGISTEPQWYLITDNIKNDFELTLLNYTGYAQATHSITLFSQTGITALSDTEKVDLKGTLSPLISNTFTLNTVTNLNNLIYTNLSTNESISWTKTWTAGDSLVFDSSIPSVTTNLSAQDFSGKIPANNLGTNYLKMNIIQSSSSTISQLLGSSLESGSELFTAQSFTPSITGTLTSITASLQLYTSTPFLIDTRIEIRSNSAGVPSNTILSTAWASENTTKVGFRDIMGIASFSQELVSGTVYWICISHLDTVTSKRKWYFDSTNPYAGGTKATSTNVSGLGSWTAQAGSDKKFSLTIEPTPSTNINWVANYKPRYI